MNHRNHCLSRGFAAMAAFLLVLPVAPPARAQKNTPTLDQVLTAVHANFNQYLNNLPDIDASEHIDSKMYIPGSMTLSGASFSMNLSLPDDGSMPSSSSTTNMSMDYSEHTIIDADFQLQHDQNNKTAYNLAEAHNVKILNGKPAPANYKFSAPFVLVGAFSYASGIISPTMKPCYDFKLQTGKKLHGLSVDIIDYTQKLSKDDGTVCLPAEPITGRAYIDAKNMQVVRFEQKRPHHALIFDNGDRRTYVWSWWAWSVDYAPATLHGQTFWLPKTITSKAISTDGSLMSWNYTNTYSNYEMFTSSITNLPGYKAKPAQK